MNFCYFLNWDDMYYLLWANDVIVLSNKIEEEQDNRQCARWQFISF